MIKFFSRIRQRLLTENNFSKYLLYAVGEILLVVLGILIALQINTWNQEYIDNKEEALLLNAIAEKITFNRFQYNKGLDRYQAIIESSLALINLRNTPYTDSLSPEIENHIFNIRKRFLFGKSNEIGIYDELTASGNLNLIQSRLLRSELTKYKANLQLLGLYEEQHLSFVDNQLNPFLSQHVNLISINNSPQDQDLYDKSIAILGIKSSTSENHDYSQLVKNKTFTNLMLELATKTKILLPIYERIDNNLKIIDSIAVIK